MTLTVKSTESFNLGWDIPAYGVCVRVCLKS